MSELSDCFGNKPIVNVIYNTILKPLLHPTIVFKKLPKSCYYYITHLQVQVLQLFPELLSTSLKEKLSLQVSEVYSFHSFPVETLRQFYLLYLDVIRVIIEEWLLEEQALFQRNHSVSTNLFLISVLSFFCILISLTVIIEFVKQKELRDHVFYSLFLLLFILQINKLKASEYNLYTSQCLNGSLELSTHQ